MAGLSLVVKAAPAKLERRAERDIARALQLWRVALMRGINSTNLNEMIRRLGNPQWPGNVAMRDALVEALERAAQAGGADGIDMVTGGTAKAVSASVDWELVNNAATDWALRYSHLLMNGISDTTRDAIAREIAYFTENSLTINQLRDRIAELGVFSKERARRIAVTETTRAYAEGNLAAWTDLDYVTGKRWNTANDDLVCPICGPLNQQVVGKADLFANRYYSPPAHVNCRCGIAPVIAGSTDAAALGGGVVGALPIGAPSLPGVNVPKFNFARDVEDWLVNNGYVESAELDQFDMATNQAIAESVAEHVTRFPGLKESLKYIGKGRLGEFSGRNSFGMYDPKTGGVLLNPDWFSDSSKYLNAKAETVAGNWSVRGDLRSTIDHEIGHALDRRYRVRQSSEFFYINLDAKALDGGIADNLSRYATTNDAEFIAEGWAEYVAGSPRPLARKIGELIIMLAGR